MRSLLPATAPSQRHMTAALAGEAAICSCIQTDSHVVVQVDGIKILEGLAASGLRSIRYALEVEGTGRVDANDLDSDAVEAMRRNIQFNGPEAEQRMRPLQGDARVVMLQSPLVSCMCNCMCNCMHSSA